MGKAYRSMRTAPRRYGWGMQSFFDGIDGWDRNDGSLHVYALPDEGVADRLESLSERLDGVPGLPRMPRSWLHFTISRLAQYDDLGQANLTRLADAIGARLSTVGPFDLRVGAPRATDKAVDCTAEPSPEWDALVAAVRGAAVEAFPEDELPAGPHAPHVALAYAVGEVPDADLEARLADAPEVGTVPIRGLHLVSVTMRPEVGTFDWTELANWEF
ncbi:hypothetical protein BW730_02070 [Tessaracoccus aquimaris]|uniref:2'-5' RNA ligase n=2 Tax=Tessaracoccus aquimaris TaxID=1332264 RepID=A0A1Q2CK44_9ACTN|nr:hypothetical protein BW730_02070 [Tessaracoccus aquimaris]